MFEHTVSRWRKDITNAPFCIMARAYKSLQDVFPAGAKRPAHYPHGWMPSIDRPRTCGVARLGTVPYGEAHAIQDSVSAARRRNELSDLALLLEHLRAVTHL